MLFFITLFFSNKKRCGVGQNIFMCKKQKIDYELVVSAFVTVYEQLEATGEATATTGEQVTPGERLSAAECDASKFISVSGTVEWTLPGVERKCHEPLVFTLSGKTNEDITVFVHMIQTGVQPFDGWISDTGTLDIWWSSDETIQYPEFIAIYWTFPKYAGCQWIGDDPEVSGLQPVAIPSSCP